jgi:hypothetical protein
MEPAYLSQSTGRHPGPDPRLAGRSAICSAALAILAGGLLRLWMLRKFFEVSGDSRLYGGLAKNLLLHGRYAISDGSGVLHSTLIRLPGYPLFLAFCFQLFGIDRYASACYIQILLDLAACVLLALFVYRISPRRSRMAPAQATLWLSALCPFTAVYAAEPLTESLTLFCIALALWSAARFQDRPAWPAALSFTIAATYAALLRPDGALVGVALAPVFLLTLRSRATRQIPLVCLLVALSPFALWTVRNWTVFHVFEPLAPRYATDPGEPTYPGWQRWVKTWALDFVSTYTIYWNVPDSPFDLKQLPARAFDSDAERAQTAALAADYEDNGEDLSPTLDARFGQLADQRIAAHPLRYYVLLPAGRVADMWLRPRVENLPIDLDWWVYAHHYSETRISWFYALLNAFYLLLAIAGLCLRPRLWPYMLAYMLLRSALLWTIEAPEARYTLECFPMIFALGGIALGRAYRRRPA